MLRPIWLVTVLFLMAFGICAPSLAQGWQEYRSNSGGYRLEFPGAPRTVTQSAQGALGTVEATVTMVVWRPGAFLSNESPVPPQLVGGDPQMILDAVRIGAVLNIKGRLREERRLSVDGAPARWFVIEIPQDKVSVVQVVLSGNLMIVATYVGPLGTETTPEVERFIGSLRLVGR